MPASLYLATALGQPVVGRLIDVFGPRRLFLVSTSLAGVAGVVGTLAPNLGVLIASPPSSTCPAWRCSP